MNAHVDVAAYALGAMDDREASQFEDHLVGCTTCATELESMVSVVSLMSDLTLDDVTGEAPVGPYTAATGLPVVGQPPATSGVPPIPPPASPVQVPPEQLGGPVLVPGSESRREERPRREDRRDERRDDWPAAASAPPPTGPTPISRGRSKRRRGGVVLLAAAAAVVGAVAGGGLVAETGYFQQEQQQDPSVEAGPALVGETYSNTDKRTGAQVEAGLLSRPWGTNVSFTVTKIKGPKECRLVAVRENGDTEVLSTWTVPDGGYGFPERPQPLSLKAATALTADDIASLRVQEIAEDGDASTLVTVRT